jgi:hypothetical protein
MDKIERIIEKMVLLYMESYELPKNFSGVAVDVYPTLYGKECHITFLFSQSFKLEESDSLRGLVSKIKTHIKNVLGNDFFDSGISSSNSTINNYEETKWWYEKQKNKPIIKEDIGDNLSSFLDEIDSKFNLSQDLRNKIEDFIQKSGCKKIEFAKFKFPALGLALHDGVLINQAALYRRLEDLLFVVFHEIAHQYQFKKYGEEKMYECYVGDISDDEAAEYMQKTEIVADEFASRKIRELQKLGLIDKSFIPPQMYKNTPKFQIKHMVTNYRMMLKRQNIKSPEKISEFFYNMVKDNL